MLKYIGLSIFQKVEPKFKKYLSQRAKRKELKRKLLFLLNQGNFVEAHKEFVRNHGVINEGTFRKLRSSFLEQFISEKTVVVKKRLIGLSFGESVDMFENEFSNIKETDKKQFDIVKSEVLSPVLKSEVNSLLEKDLYSDAVQLCGKYPFIEKVEFNNLKNKRAEKIVSEIEERFANYNFDGYEEFNEKIKRLSLWNFYCKKIHALREKYLRKQQKEKIEELLKKYLFIDADNLSKQFDFPKDEYGILKGKYIESYFKQKFNFTLSFEQALAIGESCQNLLVKARAGSGKTRSIIAKTMFEADVQKINPSNILLLAFNNKAADEMQERIREKFPSIPFRIAMTFHSLGYQLIDPKEDFIQDKEREEEIETIIKSFLEMKSFKEQLYHYFRKELEELSKNQAALSEEDYNLYKDNIRNITLDGELVKSRGEKFIADFLFEHGIKYQYERRFDWDKKSYRPDFCLLREDNSERLVIEHWGVVKNDPDKKIPSEWPKSWDDYRKEIEDKKKYWVEKNIPLMETSIADLRNGREEFEKILKERLVRLGITCEKLSEEELLKRAVDIYRNRKRIAENVANFIQKTKKNMWSLEELNGRIKQYKGSGRNKVFYRFGLEVYKKYIESINKKNKIEFDDLILRSIDKLEQEQGKCGLRLKDRLIELKDLQWVMIDEYQDFSLLFHQLVQTLKKYSSFNLFCVGDSWQAINRFAGSKLDYFRNFENNYSNARQCFLRTNYRSGKEIVELSNKLMHGEGEPAHFDSEQSISSSYEIEKIDQKVWIEARRKEERHKLQRLSDKKYIFPKDKDFMTAKYLKRCHQIIRKNLGKKVAILNRTNLLFYCDLGQFKQRLKKCFSEADLRKIGDFNEKIPVETVHRAKGIEADVVIILNVCQGYFPLIHSDASLCELFDETISDILTEEKRIFYVAATRAKKDLYILTEKGNESDYLKSIGGASIEMRFR